MRRNDRRRARTLLQRSGGRSIRGTDRSETSSHLGAGTALRKSGEHNVVEDWQTLMRRWDSACTDYSAVCEAPADRLTAGADIERARRNLVQIKEQIDALISMSSRRRAADPAPPRFALIQPTTDGLGWSSLDQTSPRYNRR